MVDNLEIDAAIDRASSRIEEAKEVEIFEESQEKTETPIVEEKEVSTKPRDESGKFTKAEKKAKKEPIKTDIPEQIADAEQQDIEVGQSEEPAPTHVSPPAFWSAEQKALFAGADPKLQEVVATRELQLQQQMSRLANESESGRRIEKRAMEVFEPYRLKLQRDGVKDPFEAAERLLAWNEIFESNPIQGITELMVRNGLTPQDLHEYVQTGGVQNYQSQEVNDPRIEKALSEVEALKASLAEKENQSLVREIETFKMGKDSYGNSRKPFAEAHAFQIDQAYQSIQKMYPDLSMNEALNHAYEYVLMQQRELFGINKPNGVPSQPKTNEQLIAQSKKAKAAASSVSGSPSNGTSSVRPRLKGDSFNELLDSAMNNAMERASIR